MPSSSHIPGLPYLKGPSVLGRLTTASAFLQLPRSPVKYRQNERSRPLPSTPLTRLPRRVAPDAPRRRRCFQAAPVAADWIQFVWNTDSLARPIAPLL